MLASEAPINNSNMYNIFLLSSCCVEFFEFELDRNIPWINASTLLAPMLVDCMNAIDFGKFDWFIFNFGTFKVNAGLIFSALLFGNICVIRDCAAKKSRHMEM